MKIKDFTYLFRIKKISRSIFVFLIILIVKSYFEDSLYYGIIENFKSYFWFGLIFSILSLFDISKVKIKIKNIINNEEKEEALKWIEQYFEKNKAELLVDTSTKRIYLSETEKGRVFKKKRQDFYFVGIKTDRIIIEGPSSYYFNF